MDEPEIPDELIARHLAGEASAADEAALQQWLDLSAVNRAEYQRLVGAWRTQSSGSGDERRPRGGESHPAGGSPLPRVLIGVVLMAVAAVVWLRTQQSAPPTVYLTDETGRRELTLSDGSEVVLAPRSTLSVPAEFGKGTRVVRLEGVAWFSARHDDNVPLTVAAADFVVRDVGTVFTVRARDEHAIEVAVIDGKVSVRLARKLATTDQPLVTGDVGQFAIMPGTDSATISVATGRPVDSLAAWKRGSLAVTDAAVRDILSELSRWYGRSISVADASLATRKITITLSLTSAEDAINALSALLHVTPNHEGPLIILR